MELGPAAFFYIPVWQMSAVQEDDTPGLGTLSASVPWTRVRIHPGNTPNSATLLIPEPTGFGTPNTARLPDLILNSAQAIKFDSEFDSAQATLTGCAANELMGLLLPPSPLTN